MEKFLDAPVVCCRIKTLFDDKAKEAVFEREKGWSSF